MPSVPGLRQCLRLRRAPAAPGAGSGACHRPRPFHTKHPVGNARNFYTARSRWTRRPFEVLFVGRLQAFLIAGSLRRASLPPGFCLLVLAGEGYRPTVGLGPTWRALCPPPAPGLAREGPAWPQDATRVLAALRQPPRQSILRQHLMRRLCRLRLRGRREHRFEEELQRKSAFFQTGAFPGTAALRSVPTASPQPTCS